MACAAGSITSRDTWSSCGGVVEWPCATSSGGVPGAHHHPAAAVGEIPAPAPSVAPTRPCQPLRHAPVTVSRFDSDGEVRTRSARS